MGAFGVDFISPRILFKEVKYIYMSEPSRVEDILVGVISGTPSSVRPQSRVEQLLTELQTAVDGKADLDENGLIPTSEIPPEVFERMKVVEDDTARFALTTDDVQNGDVVYVNDDEVMYYVYDDTKLNLEAGYKPFASGIAAKAIADKNGNDITTEYIHDEGTYFTVNGIRIYVSNTAPTGNIPDGSIGLGF